MIILLFRLPRRSIPVKKETDPHFYIQFGKKWDFFFLLKIWIYPVAVL